jgi:hypothetical protein
MKIELNLPTLATPAHAKLWTHDIGCPESTGTGWVFVRKRVHNSMFLQEKQDGLGCFLVTLHAGGGPETRYALKRSDINGGTGQIKHALLEGRH